MLTGEPCFVASTAAKPTKTVFAPSRTSVARVLLADPRRVDGQVTDALQFHVIRSAGGPRPGAAHPGADYAHPELLHSDNLHEIVGRPRHSTVNANACSADLPPALTRITTPQSPASAFAGLPDRTPVSASILSQAGDLTRLNFGTSQSQKA